MSVQAIRITTYAPATVGSISRIKLVSQAVTGPTGATGATGEVPSARTISTTAPLAGGGDLGANRTLTVSAASDTAAGVVELATSAETIAGVDDVRAVTPAALAAAAADGGWPGGGGSDPLDGNAVIAQRIFAR